jgi:hypothetical protein
LAPVQRVAAELALDVEIRPTIIGDQAAAERARFVGSPTVRVNGHDVDPEGDWTPSTPWSVAWTGMSIALPATPGALDPGGVTEGRKQPLVAPSGDHVGEPDLTLDNPSLLGEPSQNARTTRSSSPRNTHSRRCSWTPYLHPLISDARERYTRGPVIPLGIPPRATPLQRSALAGRPSYQDSTSQHAMDGPRLS